jgi:TPR repeat protein
LAAYHGKDGAQQDAEDAALWLGRALRQAMPPGQTLPGGGGGGGFGTGSGSGAASGAAAAARSQSQQQQQSQQQSQQQQQQQNEPPPEQLDAETRTAILTEGALVLGYLYVDGEGVAAADRSRAVALFKLSADAGCAEAESVLGWMFNTGQYE